MTLADDRLRTQVFELSVPPQPQSVSVCRLFVAAVTRHFGIGEEAVGDLKVAVSEAVTNSIKAHQASRRDTVPVRIRVICDESACIVEVLDQGGGFALPEVSATGTPPSGLYEGSLGLLLIRSLFPSAEILSSASDGTTVRFAVGR